MIKAIICFIIGHDWRHGGFSGYLICKRCDKIVFVYEE